MAESFPRYSKRQNPDEAEGTPRAKTARPSYEPFFHRKLVKWETKEGSTKKVRVVSGPKMFVSLNDALENMTYAHLIHMNKTAFGTRVNWAECVQHMEETLVPELLERTSINVSIPLAMLTNSPGLCDRLSGGDYLEPPELRVRQTEFE